MYTIWSANQLGVSGQEVMFIELPEKAIIIDFPGSSINTYWDRSLPGNLH